MDRKEYRRGTVKYDPTGYACNMRWVLLDDEGEELYRGPEWAVRLRHTTPVRLDNGMRASHTEPQPER